MATGFMTRSKADAPVDPREALSLDRQVPDYVAALAQRAALTARRAEEAARVTELEQALPASESALSDLEVAHPDDTKAIASAAKALERLRQDLADCRRRGAAYTRAIAALGPELERLMPAAIQRIGAAGRALHEQAVLRKARALREALAADEAERAVVGALIAALRPFRPGHCNGFSRADVAAGQFVTSPDTTALREAAKRWLAGVAKAGYWVEDAR
jgi:hypothetical protein